MSDPAAGLTRYVVGGAVRDALLGVPVHDEDWVVVGARVDDMLARGFKAVGSDFPVFLHPHDGSEHALARTERKTGPGHTGFECISDPNVTLEEDLARRDLTINAMARSPDGTIVDPFGGQDDLRERLLRHVSPAFSEDPLRVLRCARFAAQLGVFDFEIAPATLELMRAMAVSGELQTLTPERIWQETNRAHQCPRPAPFWRVLLAVDALPAVFAELADGNWDVRLAALDAALPLGDVEVRLAALVAAQGDDAGVWRRIRAPRRVSEVADLAIHMAGQMAGQPLNSLDAAALLSMLRRADVLRRPDRFDLVLRALEAAGSINGAQRRGLLDVGTQLAGIDVGALRAQGLDGAALGEALQTVRLQRVAAWLEQLP